MNNMKLLKKALRKLVYVGIAGLSLGLALQFADVYSVWVTGFVGGIILTITIVVWEDI